MIVSLLDFFDDITIFSKNVSDHLTHVKLVLDALSQAGLRLNREKCIFFTDKIEFLGFTTISHNSVTVSESKVQSIRNYPVPKTVKDIKKLLDLAGFYSKLIPNYDAIIEPLSVMRCKNASFRWTDQCQKSFDKLIKLLCSSPIVTMPNPNLTFIVKVDSSKFGVGCTLEQEDPVTKHRKVIEYSSRKYNNVQRNYPSIELEVCGLLYAVKHWQCYLIGKKFIVETDSKAVQWIRGKRDCLGKLGR